MKFILSYCGNHPIFEIKSDNHLDPVIYFSNMLKKYGFKKYKILLPRYTYTGWNCKTGLNAYKQEVSILDEYFYPYDPELDLDYTDEFISASIVYSLNKPHHFLTMKLGKGGIITFAKIKYGTKIKF